MKRLVILTLLLAGCAPTPRPAAVRPPPKPCVNAAEIPPEPPMVGGKFNGDAKHDLQILAPNAIALRQWGEQLQALVQGCLAEKPAEEAAPAAGKRGG